VVETFIRKLLHLKVQYVTAVRPSERLTAAVLIPVRTPEGLELSLRAVQHRLSNMQQWCRAAAGPHLRLGANWLWLGHLAVGAGRLA